MEGHDQTDIFAWKLRVLPSSHFAAKRAEQKDRARWPKNYKTLATSSKACWLAECLQSQPGGKEKKKKKLTHIIWLIKAKV